MLYVIKSVSTYKDKQGIDRTTESYLERIGLFGLRVTVWTRLEDAMKFTTLSEARRYKRMNNISDKRVSIIKVQAQNETGAPIQMNSYPKPISGSYKHPLIEGLKVIGMTKEADLVAAGQITFGIVASFTGNVKTLPKQLCNDCILALQSVPLTDVTGYYLHELRQGNIYPCNPSGSYVYNEADATAVAYVKAKLKAERTTIINPFFTS